MNQREVDYHIHSYYSDGTLSPTEIVKWAKAKGCVEIALTDHDGIDGVREAMIAGEALDVKVLSGIEFSVSKEDGGALHLLGYKFDIDDPQLNEELKSIKEYRRDRNERLLQALRDNGYDITYDDIRKVQGKDYVGKPNIARAMETKGYISKWKDAFKDNEYLDKPEIRAIKRKRISEKRAIELITGAGGIAALAHPMKISTLGIRGTEEFYSNLDTLIKRLKGYGMNGIECYHTDQTPEESLKLVEFAEKYHLMITKGSDYHG